MDQNEVATTVAQAVGQALGEMSVAMGVVVLALTNAVARQGGIDKRQLFDDLLAHLPEVDGAGANVLDVVRQAIEAAVSDAEGGDAR